MSTNGNKRLLRNENVKTNDTKTRCRSRRVSDDAGTTRVIDGDKVGSLILAGALVFFFVVVVVVVVGRLQFRRSHTQ
jgi:hypothetical protein